MTSLAVFFIIGAYLLGSVSSAIVVTRVFTRQDIRTQGSGNPGATNVYRVAGKKAAAIVFLFDALKGVLPVYFGFLYGLEPLELSAVAISACLGHIFPIFYKFKGGKGVATAIGAIFPIHWGLTLCLLSTWTIVFFVSRISSLAAVVSLTMAPIYTYIFKPDFTLPVLLLCLIILLKHKSNLISLVRHQESSFRKRNK